MTCTQVLTSKYPIIVTNQTRNFERKKKKRYKEITRSSEATVTNKVE